MVECAAICTQLFRRVQLWIYFIKISVTRLPLKASEFYANYLFKFLQIETLILVKNSTSNELSYCIRNFKCEEFFQTSLYIDIGKCWSLQTLEDRRLQRSRIQQKVLDI